MNYFISVAPQFVNEEKELFDEIRGPVFGGTVRMMLHVVVMLMMKEVYGNLSFHEVVPLDKILRLC